MSKKYFLFILFFFFLHSIHSQVFWQDDFEGTSPEMGGGTRVSSVGDPQDGICCTLDRFVRTNLLAAGTCCGCSTAFSNISNAWAWSGEDLDGTAPCSNPIQTITWSGIDISGRSNLEFIGLFGSRDGTSWETTDLLKIEYRIDAGALQEGFCFSPTTDGNLDLGLDADCDATADGATITTALTEYSFSIPSTGTSMELIFTANVNSGGEEFAIDNFRLSEGTALPVELTSFTATLSDKNILLEWQTTSEVNNDYFQIEHSVDGQIFMALDKTQGKGNTLQVENYSYVDTQPKTGVNYYRLKQVDFDGNFDYSQIVAIEYINDKNGVSIYPNPFNQTVTLQFPLLEQNYSNFSTRTIEIYDIFGQLVQSTKASINETNIKLDLSKLSSGAFILKVLNGNNTMITKRITKL